MKMRRRLIFALMSSLTLLGTSVALSAAGEAETEYDRRAATIRKLELDELIELVGWCQKKELERQARTVLAHIKELDPNNLEVATLEKDPYSTSTRPYLVDTDLHLIDGGRLRGKVRLRHVRLKTPYGTLIFPPRSVNVIIFNMNGGEDVVVTNKFTMGGNVDLGSFVASTKLGSVKVDTNKLSRLRVMRQCPQCKGKNRITCRRCRGRGQVTRKFVCPVCRGENVRKRCPNCVGTGRIVCRRCGGRGTWWSNLGTFLVQERCTYCYGRGWLRCRPCKGRGLTFCPRCNGTGKATELLECPECKKAKTVPCIACNSTGYMPVPKVVWPIRPRPANAESAADTTETP